MTGAELTALLPGVATASAAVVVMLAAVFSRSQRLILALTLAGLALALATLPAAWAVAPRQVTPLFVVDRYALFYAGLVLAASLTVAALCHVCPNGRVERPAALYSPLLLATLGAVVLVASKHFASFFLGLEILSVALFAMIACPCDDRRPLAAGLKYLILAGVSSAFLLFGMALVYADLGTLQFPRPDTGDRGTLASVYVATGLALILAGVGFKLSLAPFHLWTPDVYQDVPAPVAAFLASVAKTAVFALLLRYFVGADAASQAVLWPALGLLAIASMLVGNLLALGRDRIERMLAYASTAHMGYLLVALPAGGTLAVEAATFFLVAYCATMLGAFAAVMLLAPEREGEADAPPPYRGLFRRRPWMAAALTAMLLSLAGFPLTAGFVGRFYLLAAGVDAALWWPVTALVVGSVIGLFYYLRIVVAMAAASPETAPGEARLPAVPLRGGLILAALALLLVWLGVYPAPLIELIRAAAAGLS